jgi:hypothetical protein
MKTIAKLDREYAACLERQRQRSRQDTLTAWSVAIIGMAACIAFSSLAAWLRT